MKNAEENTAVEAERKQPNLCPQCGTSLPPEDRFCSICGYIRDTRPPQEAEAAPPAKGKKRWLTAVICLVLVAALGLGLILERPQTPEKVMDTYLEAMENADIETMVSCWPPYYVSFLQKMADTPEGWEVFLRNVQQIMEALMGTMSYEVDSIQKLSDSDLRDLKARYEQMDVTVQDARNVDVSIRSGSSGKYNLTFQMLKIDGKWYVLDEQFNRWIDSY